MAKMNLKGRSKSRNFIMLRNDIYDSAAWSALCTKSRCIYLELRRRYNGHNNGEVSLSMREAAKVAKSSKSTAHKALMALDSHGFIAMINKGHFRNRHATTWRLTCEATEAAPPSNEWRNWQLDKT
jgi:hypothetical protein